MRSRPLTLRYRLDVAARIVAALAGSYGVATLAAVACARALPLARIEAVLAGTILTLPLMPITAMACFWARSAGRAWAGLLLCAAGFAVVALIGGSRP